MEPLAQRLRPRTLDEICGQQHLLGKNQVFRRTVESGHIPNMIFYGPSGVGKTTVASIIAAGSGMKAATSLTAPPPPPATSSRCMNDIGTLGTDGRHPAVSGRDPVLQQDASSKACWNV